MTTDLDSPGSRLPPRATGSGVPTTTEPSSVHGNVRLARKTAPCEPAAAAERVLRRCRARRRSQPGIRHIVAVILLASASKSNVQR